jgi:hypothetical protein
MLVAGNSLEHAEAFARQLFRHYLMMCKLVLLKRLGNGQVQWVMKGSLLYLSLIKDERVRRYGGILRR